MPRIDIKNDVFNTFQLLPKDLPGALVEAAKQKEHGWLCDECFSGNRIATGLIFRALLAQKCGTMKALGGALDHLLGSECKFEPSVLQNVFETLNARTPNNDQRVGENTISDLISYYEKPAEVLRTLAEGQAAEKEKGWMREAWFFSSTNKSKLTPIEAFGYRLQISFIMGSLEDKRDILKARKALAHGWKRRERNVAEVVKDGIGNEILEGRAVIEYKSPSCLREPAEEVEQDGVGDENYVARGGLASDATPARTRAAASTASPRSTPRSAVGRFGNLLKSVGSAFVIRKKPKQQNNLINQDGVQSDGDSVLDQGDEDGGDTEDPSRTLCFDGSPGVSEQAHIVDMDSSDDGERDKTSMDERSATGSDIRTKRQAACVATQNGFEEGVDDFDEEDDDQEKDALDVVATVARLAAVGSWSVRETTKAILVGSVGFDKATELLLKNGYPETMKEQVIQRRREKNRKAITRTKKWKEEPLLVEEVCKKEFSRPLSDSNARERALNNFNECLLEGKDIRLESRPTSISQEKVDTVVRWVLSNCQFRPGKTRGVKFRGTYVRDLPFYIRYGSLRDNFDAYSCSVEKTMRIGEKTFNEILLALTRKGTYNQGLSYFYVDFIDLMDLLFKMLKRLEKMIDNPEMLKREKAYKESTEYKEAHMWLERAREHVQFSSEYLRHRFYAEIKKSSDCGYVCAEHALGKQCEHVHSFSNRHPMHIVSWTHITLNYAIVNANNAIASIYMKDCINETEFDEYTEETDTMFQLVELAELEIKHYAKHLVRGWWQDEAIKGFLKELRECPGRKACITDHKNKLLPNNKNQAMTGFFSQTGISVLGGNVLWAGAKTLPDDKGGTYDVEGIFSWFIDIVMLNVHSQETRDMMPCIQAIRSEINNKYFVEDKGAGPTDELFFLSDNALTAAALTPFIHGLNKQATVCNDRPVSKEALREDLSDSDDGTASGRIHREIVNDFIRLRRFLIRL